MPKLSAGLLLYRVDDGSVEVLIGHPGGPFWAKKDDGAWSIPKGEYTEGEDPLARRPPRIRRGDRQAAARRAAHRLAAAAPAERQNHHRVRGAGRPRPGRHGQQHLQLEWPKGSGNVREYPEIDRVDWFSVDEARSKLLKGQRPLLDQLMHAVEDAESDGSQ